MLFDFEFSFNRVKQNFQKLGRWFTNNKAGKKVYKEFTATGYL